jgi:hypothetical protein
MDNATEGMSSHAPNAARRLRSGEEEGGSGPRDPDLACRSANPLEKLEEGQGGGDVGMGERRSGMQLEPFFGVVCQRAAAVAEEVSGGCAGTAARN